MAGSSLLTLLDDIATVLDDVAILSKVAAKKTAGVLGDDLALNAEQVSGVRAEREIPVVLAVAKGSFINKLILVPAALAISALLPWLIVPLLMIGGAYLCYEGFEKIAHKFLHSEESSKEKKDLLAALKDPKTDLVQFEKKKIKGAIRTDFILSAEIIVIALGTVKDATFGMQVAVVSTIAIVITFGVYGLVAGIVKLDDAGLYLLKSKGHQLWSNAKRTFGKGLLLFAPILMKLLTVLGTIAMFLVGGGILLHGIPGGESVLHWLTETVKNWGAVASSFSWLVAVLVNGLFGILAGALLMPLVSLALKFKKRISKAKPVPQ